MTANSTAPASRPSPSAFPGRLLVGLGCLGGLMLLAGVLLLRFDVVVHAQGVVEGRSTLRIHAPRSGRLVEIAAHSGMDVAQGDLLFVVEGEDVEKDLYEARLRRAEARRVLREARLRLAELEQVGLGFESLAARRVLPLRAEELRLMEEVEGIYTTLKEGGTGTRMEEIDFSMRRLALRQQYLRDQLRVSVEEDGLLALVQERERGVLKEAEELLTILEERVSGLEAAKERLRVTAPGAGRLTRVRFTDPGASVERGELLASLYEPSQGYLARMVVADRNVDLIRPGMAVRLKSDVFAATAEGYIHGRVLELVRDEEARVSGGFEVQVSLDHSPVEPVIGSRIRGEIILQKQGLSGFLRQKPLRDPPAGPVKERPAS